MFFSNMGANIIVFLFVAEEVDGGVHALPAAWLHLIRGTQVVGPLFKLLVNQAWLVEFGQEQRHQWRMYKYVMGKLSTISIQYEGQNFVSVVKIVFQ